MSYKTLLILLCIPVASVAAIFFLCEFVLHPPGKVVMEKKSRDGRFTALVEEHSGTLAHLDDGRWDHDVYIRNNTFFGIKTHAENFWGKIRADGKEGIDIDWTAPDCLQISYCMPDSENASQKIISTCFSRIKIEICKAECGHEPTEEERNICNLACAQISESKFDEAISNLNACLRTNPTYSYARHNLCVAHNNRGISAAKTSISRALKEFYLAYYYSQNENSLTNIEQIDEANSEEKDKAAMHKRLSKVALQANDLVGAYVELELAALIKSDDKIQKELAKLEGELKARNFLTPSRKGDLMPL